jgi:hypothetical protein
MICQPVANPVESDGKASRIRSRAASGSTCPTLFLLGYVVRYKNKFSILRLEVDT